MLELFSSEEQQKWTELADEYRPDLKFQKNLTDIAREQVSMKKGAYLPTVSFNGGYGGASTPYLSAASDTFNNQTFDWAVGLSLNWQIFDGTGRERRIQKAKYERNALQYAYEDKLLEAHTQVRHQIYRLEMSLASFFTAKDNLALAEETLKQAKDQLQIGFINVYDYLYSVDALIRTQNNLTQARFELFINYCALLQSAGVKEI